MDRTPDYNTLAADKHLAAQDKRDEAAAAEVNEVAEATFASMDKWDVSDTLCCDAMAEAVQTGNVDLIGRVALHLMQAWASRCAVRTVYNAEIDYKVAEAEAAALVAAHKGAKQ